MIPNFSFFLSLPVASILKAFCHIGLQGEGLPVYFSNCINLVRLKVSLDFLTLHYNILTSVVSFLPHRSKFFWGGEGEQQILLSLYSLIIPCNCSLIATNRFELIFLRIPLDFFL